MRAALRVWLGLGVIAVGASAAWPSAARAEPPPLPAAPPPPAPASTKGVSSPPPSARARPKAFPRLAEPTLSHYQQLGIAVLPGTGYRGIFPYQDNVDCGQPQKRVCTGRLPTFLDVQPSFGFGQRWDVLLDLRFGLGQDFTHTHELAVAPGVRYWVDPEESAKFFTTAQLVYDVTPQHDAALQHNDDLAFRNSNGFMFEVMRNFGAYVQFGETIGFVRWLRFEIDAGVGVQARLP
jgi:hypothetical protein